MFKNGKKGTPIHIDYRNMAKMVRWKENIGLSSCTRITISTTVLPGHNMTPVWNSHYGS